MNVNNHDIFVIKYVNGTLAYAKSFGSAGNDVNPGVAVAPDGTTYIAGEANDALHLDGLGQPMMQLPHEGGKDGFLVKLDATGKYVWAYDYGDPANPSTPTNQNISSITLDPLGHIIIGGMFEGSIKFGQTPTPMSNMQDIYVAKLDANAAEIWTHAYVGNGNQSSPRLATDAKSNVLLTGSFAGVLPFISGKPLSKTTKRDIFVAKLAP